jgi:nucleoredoxin
MPWLALPYQNRELKDTLAKKYKVSGIPTLVVLDSQAQTITTNGRGKVTSNPEDFPWSPKSLSQIFTGSVIDGKGQAIEIDSLKSNTALGFYFSAHWCPPCRTFTPQLIKTYNDLKAAGKKFEIIFASSDNDEESFKEYFHEMPWLSFPYGDKRIKELSEHYEIDGIPKFIIVDPATGTTTNKSGRGAVSGDPTGADFPWNPKPLNSVETAGGDLNDYPSLLYIEKELSDETTAILSSVANEYVEKWKKEKKDPLPVNFFYGKEGNLAQKVKEFCNVKTDPTLLILDIQGARKFVHHLSGKPSEADFRNFVEGFLAGTLTKKGIKDE